MQEADWQEAVRQRTQELIAEHSEHDPETLPDPDALALRIIGDIAWKHVSAAAVAGIRPTVGSELSFHIPRAEGDRLRAENRQRQEAQREEEAFRNR